MLRDPKKAVVLLNFLDNTKEGVRLYRLGVISQVKAFCDDVENGKNPTLRIENEHGVARVVSLPEFALIFHTLHFRAIAGGASSAQYYERMLEERLRLFCEAHARGEQPDLSIATMEGGSEKIVDLHGLVRIFRDLHCDLSFAEGMTFNTSFPVSEQRYSEYEHLVMGAIKLMIEVALKLKIILKEIPHEIRQWVGEINGYPLLKHHEI